MKKKNQLLPSYCAAFTHDHLDYHNSALQITWSGSQAGAPRSPGGGRTPLSYIDGDPRDLPVSQAPPQLEIRAFDKAPLNLDTTYANHVKGDFCAALIGPLGPVGFGLCLVASKFSSPTVGVASGGW